MFSKTFCDRSELITSLSPGLLSETSHDHNLFYCQVCHWPCLSGTSCELHKWQSCDRRTLRWVVNPLDAKHPNLKSCDNRDAVTIASMTLLFQRCHNFEQSLHRAVIKWGLLVESFELLEASVNMTKGMIFTDFLSCFADPILPTPVGLWSEF